MYQIGKPTPPTIIRFTGVWDMQDLYEAIADWFRRKKYKLHEKVYKHKHPSPFGIERQYIWQAQREEDEYTEVVYDMYIHTYDAHEIDVVMPDGTKKLFTKGRLWMEVKVEVKWDHEKRWNTNYFYNSLKDFYNKYIIRKRYMHGWSPKFRTEMYQFQRLVKLKLKLENDEFEQKYISGVHKKGQ